MFRVSHVVSALCVLLAVGVTASSAFRLPEAAIGHHCGNLTNTRVLNGSLILTHVNGVTTSTRIENGTISMFVKPGNATAVVQNGTVTVVSTGGRSIIAKVLNGTLNLVLLNSGTKTQVSKIHNGTFALELFPGYVIIGSVLNGTVNYGNGTNCNGFNGTVTLAPPNPPVTSGNSTFNLPTAGPFFGNGTVGPILIGTVAPPSTGHHCGNLTYTRVLNGSLILTHVNGVTTSTRIENGTISMFVKPGNATAVVQNGTVTVVSTGGRSIIAKVLNGTLNLVLLNSGTKTQVSKIHNGTFTLELFPGYVIIGSVLNGTVNYGNGTNCNGFNGTVTLAPPNPPVTSGNSTFNLPTAGPFFGNGTVGPILIGTVAPPSTGHHCGNLTYSRVLNGSLILTHANRVKTSTRIENGTISMFVKPGNATAVVQNGTVTVVSTGGRPIIAKVLNGTLNLVLLNSGTKTQVAKIHNGTFALELFPGYVIIGSVLNGTVNYRNGTNCNGFNGTVTLAPPNQPVTSGNSTFNLPTAGPFFGTGTVGPVLNGTVAPPLNPVTQGSGFVNGTATQAPSLNPITKGSVIGNGTVGPIRPVTEASPLNPVTQGAPLGKETKGPKKAHPTKGHHSRVTIQPMNA